MATTTSSATASGPSAEPRLGALARPVAAIVGVWGVSLVLWWLLIDPKWGIFDNAYPQPTGAYLFWVIGVFIIAAFNFGAWPFARFRQPLAGIAQVVTHVVLGCAAAAFIVQVLGRWDAVFSSGAAGKAGYLGCALIVLPGFYCWTIVTAHWGNWPYADLNQPRQGLGAFLIGSFMTMVLFFLLIHPELAGGHSAGPFRIGTTVGWLYSVIVIALLFAMIWRNWPWSSIGNPAGVLLSVPLCFGLGTGLYLGLRELLQAITPDAVLDSASFNLGFEVANLGVCIAFWALVWGLILPSPPGGPGLVKAVVRTVLVGGLGLATYLVYVRWFATQVLHEPAYNGNDGGFALLWMNWVIMILLWYAVSFGAAGLRRPTPEA
jgi:hypothetical protein